MVNESSWIEVILGNVSCFIYFSLELFLCKIELGEGTLGLFSIPLTNFRSIFSLKIDKGLRIQNWLE